MSSNTRYVGSSLNIDSRWREHRSKLRRSVHSSHHLQNSWNKYGEFAFLFGVIEECPRDPQILWERETFWLKHYEPHIFNLVPSALPCFGIRRSPEQRAKMSKSKMGNQYGKGHFYCGKLTALDVSLILHRYAIGESIISIAKEFKIHPSHVSRLASRTIWKQVSLPPKIEEAISARSSHPHRGKHNSKAKLNANSVQEIRERLLEGQSPVSIAPIYQVTPAAIRAIQQGRTYAYLPHHHKSPNSHSINTKP